MNVINKLDNFNININKPYNYYDYKLEKQLQSLYISYLTDKSKTTSLKSLSSILHIIFKLRNETNVNYNVYISYLIIIIFHKRQFKNDKINKNSKEIFYESLLMLYDYEHKLVLTLIYSDLIGLYGYNKDYIQIWRRVVQKMKKDYKINDYKQTRIEWFYHFFKKYNLLIVAISNILLFKRNKDYLTLDNFIKLNSDKLSNHDVIHSWTKFGLDHIINDTSKNKHLKILRIFEAFIKISDDCKLPYLSKTAMWIPREGRDKDIFWFIRPYAKINNTNDIYFYSSLTTNYNFRYLKYYLNRNNFKFKKISCFNYLVLCDKMLYKNIDNFIVNNLDKKRFRTTNSILNLLIDTPQINMCKNRFQDINFLRCGSKFIHKNKDLLLMNKEKPIYGVIKKEDRKICKTNVSNFLEIKKIRNKEKYLNSDDNSKNVLYYINNQLNIFMKSNYDNDIIKQSKMIKKILNHKKYELIYPIINEYFL